MSKVPYAGTFPRRAVGRGSVRRRGFSADRAGPPDPPQKTLQYSLGAQSRGLYLITAKLVIRKIAAVRLGVHAVWSKRPGSPGVGRSLALPEPAGDRSLVVLRARLLSAWYEQNSYPVLPGARRDASLTASSRTRTITIAWEERREAIGIAGNGRGGNPERGIPRYLFARFDSRPG
jgi:hypothetical protein